MLFRSILEPFAAPSLHLSIVAGEHHEAADGSGYPRRRLGGHRVLRSAEEKRSIERITLASEIVAVADLYERLVSPGPGFAGRSPAAARPILEAAAGESLNREIVLRLQGEIAKALRLREVHERLAGEGAIPVGSTPEAFTAFLQAETAKWAQAVRAANLRPETL